MSETPITVPRLVATTVVRDATPNQSSGGVYLVDFTHQAVVKAIDWTRTVADLLPAAGSADGDHGLRGVAFSDSEMYVAASDELLVLGPDFRPRKSWRNGYLHGCSEISLHGRNLFLACSANDCVLAFDLETLEFSWALHLARDGEGMRGTPFDPKGIGGPGGADGPPARNRLGLNSVHAESRGLFVSGLNTQGLLQVGKDRSVRRIVDMPEGIHNAQPLGDGVIFNDTAAAVLRFAGRDGSQQVFPVPTVDAEGRLVTSGDPAARGGMARGLCAIDESRIAGGASPAVVTLYDLHNGETIGSVDFSAGPGDTIHSLAVWPFDREAPDAQPS